MPPLFAAVGLQQIQFHAAGPNSPAASRHPFARLSDVRPYETADHRAANFAGRAGARCVSTTRFDSIEPQSAQSESTNVLSATGAGRLPTAEMPIELGICTTTAATVDRPNTLIAMPANHLCRCGDLKTTLRTLVSFRFALYAIAPFAPLCGWASEPGGAWHAYPIERSTASYSQ